MTGTAQAGTDRAAGSIRSLFDDEDSQWILRFDSMLKYAQTSNNAPPTPEDKTPGVEMSGSVPSSPAQSRRTREKKYSLPNPTLSTASPPTPRGIPVSLDRQWRGNRATSAPPVKRHGIPVAKPVNSLSNRTPSYANGAGGGPMVAGSVDEQVFLQAFEENTPLLQLQSSRDLDMYMTQVRTALGNPDIDWEKRMAILKTLRGVVRSGGAMYEEFFAALRLLEIPFQTSVRDLRSQIVREACITMAYLCRELGRRVDHFCEILLPSLIQLIGSAAKIMSSSGITCIHFMLQHTHSPKLIPLITRNLTSKSREIRRYCCEFLHQVLLIWPASSLEKHIITIQDAIKKGISDADSEARSQARKAFWGFADHFPKEADRLLLSLDVAKQRLLHNGTNGENLSVSRRHTDLLSNSRSSSRQRLDSIPLSSQTTPTRGRQSRISQSQPNSRSASPSSRLSYATYNMLPDGRVRKSGIPTPTTGRSREPSPTRSMSGSSVNIMQKSVDRRNSLTRPPSRNRYDSLDRVLRNGRDGEERIRNAFSTSTQPYASPLTSRVAFSASQQLPSSAAQLQGQAGVAVASCSQLHSQGDSEGSSSICSDISRHEDMADILLSLASVHWSDRKEGLLGLKNVLRSHSRRLSELELCSVTQTMSKMFMDPHTKVFSLFLDTLCELVSSHSVELHTLGFLPILLTKLFTKLGQDLLSSVNTKIQSTLGLVRDAFPRHDQFIVITRFLNDPVHQSTSVKVKLTVLRYLLVLTRLMDSSEVPSNDPNMRDCLHRFVAWASDSRPTELAQLARACIGSLYRCKASYFSLVIHQMAPEYQRIALDIIQSELLLQHQQQLKFDHPQPQKIILSNGGGSSGVSRSGSDSLPSPMTPQKLSSSPMRSLDYFDLTDNPASLASEASPGTQGFSSGSDERLQDSPSRSFHPSQKTQNSTSGEGLSHCVSVLSSPLNSCELKRAALRELTELLKCSNLWNSEYNFRSTLKILLDNTGAAEEEAPIRAESLKVLALLVEQHPEHFETYADLTFVKLLQTQMDKDVQKESDNAMLSVLKSARVHKSAGILARFVAGCQDCNMIAAAIKMMSKLVELSSSEDLVNALPTITPALLSAYNHDESAVRRAAVFCLVSLHQKVGAAIMEPYLAAVQGCKLRLLKLYIERAAQQKTLPHSNGINLGPPGGVSSA
ncbi:CLIP-associating protein 1-A [Galendromus occidentalis]|uniref:CLIP-associating protein 1-A n=1 Tax=Galendromus occidentalis TaxID=34638 RepID=A0AAJ7SE20_9ACAR|nr:CLIP-associating protein 1-A [Galendromus occidentalis]